MTDENNQTDSQSVAPTASSSDQGNNTVPISRLNELIAERNELRQQTHMMHQTLNQLLADRRPAQAPREESPEMKELRESNPALYRQMMLQRKELAQLRAANLHTIETIDRQNFTQEFGKEGKERLQEVERLLEQERAAGNFKVNRAGVFVWLKGQEQLRKENNRHSQENQAQLVQAAQQSSPQSTAPKQSVQSEDIPSSIPSGSTFVNGSRAPQSFGEATPASREEMLRQMKERLKNQAF